MKPVYRIDKFVDFNGVEREFIIAAVSVDLDKDSKHFTFDNASICVENMDEDYLIPTPKLLLLGVSVRNINDEYNEELGMKIALGKALKLLDCPEKKTGKIIAVSDKGLINSAVVSAILDQEAMYFKRNPGSYITGYDKQARKKQNNTSSFNNRIFKYFLDNQARAFFYRYCQH